MAKTRFNIKSTPVDGDYGIVDVSINNSTVATNVHLTGNYVTYEYDTLYMPPGTNTLTVSLKNAKANDNNNDGDYNDPGDETMKVTVSNLEVATDNVNYVVYLPKKSSNVYDESGNITARIPPVNDFEVWGEGYTFTFEIV